MRRSERLGWRYVGNVHWNNRSVWLGNHTLQAIALPMLWFAMPQSPRDDASIVPYKQGLGWPHTFYVSPRRDEGIPPYCVSPSPLSQIPNCSFLIFNSIAIFKIKAHIRRSGTSRNNQRQSQSEKHSESHLEEHPASSP